jgi:poly(A) polymerase
MDWELAETAGLTAARGVAERLRGAGFAAFFAGGCVRDLLLGREAKDFDVATSARPEEVVALFRSAGMRTMEVGAHFGVILVVQEDVAIEVATFRHDGVYLDGRRPEAVRFSTDAREDVVRRDFTINGMLLDPWLMVDEAKNNEHGGHKEHGGKATEGMVRVPESAVLDFVGGRADLEAGLVRTIGSADLRFEEDKLRMLRGVRFAARLGFRIEEETLRAMRRHAAEIGQVSNERVRDELTRMLTEGQARRAFEMLDESGLLAQVLPEAAKMKGVEQPPEFHPEGDVWVHTLLLLERLPAGVSSELAWGFLLHDVGKPATFQPPDPKKPGDRIRFNGHVEVGVRVAEVLLNRLRFSNEEKTQIVALIKHHMQFGDVKAMKESTLKRFVRMPRFEEHLALHRADCLSAHGDLRLWEFAKEAYERDEPEATRPRWLVTGKELIAAGYRSGVGFKKMLEAAEDAQLEGRIATVEEGLELVRREFGEPAKG